MKSVVREICTPRSVGLWAPQGAPCTRRPAAARRWVYSPKLFMSIRYLLLSLFAAVLVAGPSTAKGLSGAQAVGARPVWDASDVALLLIDYQPEMFSQIRSSDPAIIELNAKALARSAKALNIPTVLSTVGVGLGVNKPTIESIKADLPEGLIEIDRTSMNSWEDAAFLKAVKATGKKRMIILGLYTEICLVFPVVEALADGYEVMIVSDAVGGMGKLAHETAVMRMIESGAIPTTTLALMTEFFRDWKDPRAEKLRPIMNWYIPQYTKPGVNP